MTDETSNQPPEAEWSWWPTPADAGADPAGIAAALALADGQATDCLMVLRGGRVVLARGPLDHRYQCHSIRKSLLAALIGIAVAEGRIDLEATLERLDVDDHLRLSWVERQARVHDLLTARSGVYHPAGFESAGMRLTKEARHSHPPGTWWSYNNWDFNALGTIYRAAVGAEIGAMFAERLAGPLGMVDFRPEDATLVHFQESRHPAYPFRLSTRDLARFAELWRRGGRWGARQLVPERWVRNAVMPISHAGVHGAYGYMWWVCRDGVHWPDAWLPPDAYSARGVGGHVALVVPSRELVILHRVDTDQPGREVSHVRLGRLFETLVAAFPPP
jgi:CubicO group peptidase (beta-lactamase class C family)